ncbi:hypothetical protein D3C85_1366660 [compost metagenome]
MEIRAILLFLTGNRIIEQHRNPLGHRLGTGHPAWLRYQQIGNVHQLANLRCVADKVDIGLTEDFFLQQLKTRFFISAETDQQLNILAPTRNVGQQLFLFFFLENAPAAAHHHDSWHGFETKLLADRLLAMRFPEVRMNRNPSYLNVLVQHAAVQEPFFHKRGGHQIFINSRI